MKAFDPIVTLALPDSVLVNRRVPKTLLIENGSPTTADKRRIQEGIEELRWLAVLKPTTIGVAEYRDEVREYIEIAVLRLVFRPGAQAERLTELVHRAVPYPVLLITYQEDTPVISLAHKRRSQSEVRKTVLDGDVVQTPIGNGCADELTTAFYNALAINRQPRTTLHALYQGWIYTVQALCAARVTGKFSIPTSAKEATGRTAALQKYEHLKKRIADLRAAASKEKQIARQVDMNLELQRLRNDRDAIRVKL